MIKVPITSTQAMIAVNVLVGLYASMRTRAAVPRLTSAVKNQIRDEVKAEVAAWAEYADGRLGINTGRVDVANNGIVPRGTKDEESERRENWYYGHDHEGAFVNADGIIIHPGEVTEFGVLMYVTPRIAKFTRATVILGKYERTMANDNNSTVSASGDMW